MLPLGSAGVLPQPLKKAGKTASSPLPIFPFGRWPFFMNAVVFCFLMMSQPLTISPASFKL
jgi:hypothetical protein